jgi:hypothetical protein
MSDKEVNVVPEFALVSPNGYESVRTFAESWRRAQQLPMPVTVALTRWVRKD